MATDVFGWDFNMLSDQNRQIESGRFSLGRILKEIKAMKFPLNSLGEKLSRNDKHLG